MCVQLTHKHKRYSSAIPYPYISMCIVITFMQPILTIEHNEDLLPLCVAHFRRLAEEDLVFVADEYAVQDKLADGDVSQIPEAAVLTHG